MKTPTRWTPVIVNNPPAEPYANMQQDKDGDYVEITDYSELLKESLALRRAVAEFCQDALLKLNTFSKKV